MYSTTPYAVGSMTSSKSFVKQFFQTALRKASFSSPSSSQGFRILACNPTWRTSLPKCTCRHYAGSVLATKHNRYSVITSSSLVSSEYADLNLTHGASEDVGHVQIRNHVNPLKRRYLVATELPDWNDVFKDATLPLMVDIGSGSGRFLLWLAKRETHCLNYLGLEIREKLAKRAKAWTKELGLSNIDFMYANATVSFEQLVSSYPGSLKMVSILCPDPHFKRKHHKRRVVQKPLVESIVNNLTPNGEVLIQSDVLDVANAMRSEFDAMSDRLKHADAGVCDAEGWLLTNPMGKRTEREIHAEIQGAQIYRRFYIKCS